MKRVFGPAALLATAAIFVGCGGGSTGGAIPQATPTASTGAQPATVQFQIVVPPASSLTLNGHRGGKFQAPSGAQSVAFALQSNDGTSTTGTAAAPTVANLSASSAGCTSSNGTITCTVSVSTSAGADVFSATTYDQPNGKGNVLGLGNVTVNAAANTTTTAPTTLAAASIGSVAVSVPMNVPEGVAATLPVVVVAKDTNGNTIIGSYASAITLSLTDASKATTLSATSLADSTSAAALTLKYNGAMMSAAASISPSVQGLGGTALTGGTFQPDGSYPTVNGATITYGYVNNRYESNTTSASPTPGPTGTPGTSTTTITTGVTFNGVPNLVQVSNTNTFGGNLTATATAYYQWNVGANSTSLSYVGQVVTSSSPAPNFIGVDYTEKCAAPYVASYTFPLASTTATNANTGSCTIESKNVPGSNLSDADSYTEVLNGDGSYTNDDTFTSSGLSGTSHTVVNGDGTAYQLYNSGDASGLNLSYVAVSGTPAPSSATIPVWNQTFSSASVPSPNPTAPAILTQTIPNWYATVGVPSGSYTPLSTASQVVKNNVALPAQCAVPSSIVGTNTITELDFISQNLDPTQGYFVNTSAMYFVNGLGHVCTTFEDYQLGMPFYSWDASSTPLTDAYFSNSVSAGTEYITATSLLAAQSVTHDSKRAMALAQAMLFPATDSMRRAARLQYMAQRRAAAIARAKARRER